MDSLLERAREAPGHEHAIGRLRDRTGAPLAEVRRLFAEEFARLEFGASVRGYLSALTARNVLALLRHRAAWSHEDNHA